MPDLTIDQLRAWLERRERMASERAQYALSRLSAQELSAANVLIVAYRELLEAIETGRLPE